MSRLRRIAFQDRVFFITTNLARNATSLSPAERDLTLTMLDLLRNRLKFLLLGYVVMPDHAHLLLATTAESVSRIMHQWKFKSAFAIQKTRGKHGPLWQSRYFDFICRRNHDVSDKLHYIHQNPVAAELVSSITDWRWSSAPFYAKTGVPLVVPDRMDFSGDPDELLWPAPWRRP